MHVNGDILSAQMDENALIIEWLSSLSSAQWAEFDAFRAGTEFCGDVRLAALAAMPVDVAVTRAVGQ